MKTEPNDTAFPRQNEPDVGLTKREYFAGQIMAAFAARSDVDWDGGCNNLAECAVKWAEELIRALNGENRP